MTDRSTDPMIAIWESVSQLLPTGEKVITWRNRNDLDYLYETGFVDTDRWKKEDWIDAFQDSLKPDGSYLVNKDQWLVKRVFRYSGKVGIPFDPLTLREGDWSRDDFEKFLREKILPSTNLSEDLFRKAMGKARSHVYVNDMFTLTKTFKMGLAQIFSLYPSPRRVRELSVAAARAKRPVKKTASPQATPQNQSSKFSKGPSKEKNMADRLAQILWKGQK